MRANLVTLAGCVGCGECETVRGLGSAWAPTSVAKGFVKPSPTSMVSTAFKTPVSIVKPSTVVKTLTPIQPVESMVTAKPTTIAPPIFNPVENVISATASIIPSNPTAPTKGALERSPWTPVSQTTSAWVPANVADKTQAALENALAFKKFNNAFQQVRVTTITPTSPIPPKSSSQVFQDAVLTPITIKKAFETEEKNIADEVMKTTTTTSSTTTKTESEPEKKSSLALLAALGVGAYFLMESM